MNISEAISQRFSQLGCERLPVRVIQVLRQKIEQAQEKNLLRIVEREVTGSKIAKIFVRELTHNPNKSKGGFKGESEAGTFDQPDFLIMPPRDETNPVTGTTNKIHAR